MPSRRYTSTHSSDSRSEARTPRSGHIKCDHSAVVGSSRSAPSRSRTRTNDYLNTPKDAIRATPGNVLCPARSKQCASTARRIIELLDSSDDEAPSEDRAPQSQQIPDTDDLDDVVTPELPPADSSAPALPDDIDVVLSSPDPHPAPIIIDADPGLAAVEGQLDVKHNERSPPPSGPPSQPLVDQRLLLDPDDPELLLLYDEFKADHTSDEEDDDDDYEKRTLRRRLHNDALLVKLGLAKPVLSKGDSDAKEVSAIPLSEEQSDQDADEELAQRHDAPRRGRGRPQKRGCTTSAEPSEAARRSSPRKERKIKYERKVKFAEDGTTKSAPLPGKTFDFAFVELPALRERARNEYVFIKDVPDIRPEDLVSWSEDEEDEEADPGNVDADAEDDGFIGCDSLGRVKTKRKYKLPDTLPDGAEISSCHQCRRKTRIPKMRCSTCDYRYCERCLTVRYDDVVFNPSSALTFRCPRCLGYCNCSQCLRRSGSGNLVLDGKERQLAFTRKRRRLADQDMLDTVEGRNDAMLAHAALEMEEPALQNATGRRIKRERHVAADRIPRAAKKRGRPSKKELGDADSPRFGPPKRRGRPPKKRETEKSEFPWTPVKIDLDLSDAVEKGQLFSRLEEYVLGRLSVARRVLKLIAAEQSVREEVVSAARPRLIVKLRMPQQVFSCNDAPTTQLPKKDTACRSDQSSPTRSNLPGRTFNISGGAQKKRGRSSHHDLEKNVWVRGAADYSTSESDLGSEVGARDEDSQDDAETENEAAFEEGRTQAFSASILRQQNDMSVASSRGSSPLTSLDELRCDSDVSSSECHAEGEQASDNPGDSADELDNSTRAPCSSASSPASLGEPYNLQRFALAVLENNDEPTKTVHAGMLQIRQAW